MEDLCVTPGVRQEVPHTRLKQAEAPGVCYMTEDVNVGNLNHFYGILEELEVREDQGATYGRLQ